MFRTEKNIWSFFTWSVIKSYFRAMWNGFRFGMPDGAFGQLPAHFLMQEDGSLHTAHYGQDMADHISWWRIRAFTGFNDKRSQTGIPAPKSSQDTDTRKKAG